MHACSSADTASAAPRALARRPLALVLAPLALPLLFAAAASAEVPWQPDVTAALRAARESGRPVLVYVTGSACGDRAPIGDPGDVHETDCEKLEMRTIGKPEFAEAAARFEPLLINLSGKRLRSREEEEVVRRWRVATLPTLLVADPWGNEILRMVGPTPPEQVVRVLRAMPGDLRPLRAAGETLAGDPESVPARVAAAGFYEQAGLRPVAERYYEQAAAAAKSDAAARRSVVVPRGLNLLVMGKPKDAARVFGDEAGQGLDAPQSDVVLFGWAMASLAAGDRAKAAELQAEMAKRFPASPYTAKLGENLGR